MVGETANGLRALYDGLARPEWTPAPSTIGLIRQFFYPIIFITFGFVFIRAALRRKIGWKVAWPFAANLAANLALTPIEFGPRRLPLASIDILDEQASPCATRYLWGSAHQDL
jgi:benzodiazapine receptor